MWSKPWKLAEGFLTGGGLIATGIMLQISVGSIKWGEFAYPVNVIILGTYLLLLGLLHLFRKKLYFVRWLGQYEAAVPALIYTIILTVVMGLVRQVPDTQQTADPIGITKMLSFWPFVLIYLWTMTILGLVTLKHLSPFSWRSIPFLLNHTGLFIAVVCATLGSADMQRLTMNVQIGRPEWRAVDKQGMLHELPIAIALKEFTIDEYPPKLMLISNKTGEALPKKQPQFVSLEKNTKQGRLLSWNLQILKQIDMAAAVNNADSTRYVEWHTVGATHAAYVKATSTTSGDEKTGWISCGSFLFPYQALKLNQNCSLVMPDPEPERFASRVDIFTKTGEEFETTIEVNKPVKVGSWKIYQLNYDETKGRWSDISVLELVSDPWLPFVYTGIGMMMLGAVSLFVTAGRRKEEKR